MKFEQIHKDAVPVEVRTKLSVESRAFIDLPIDFTMKIPHDGTEHKKTPKGVEVCPLGHRLRRVAQTYNVGLTYAHHDGFLWVTKVKSRDRDD